MGMIEMLLALQRPKIWARFRGLRDQPVPRLHSVDEAYKQGLQVGYGKGLVDGVDLGMSVNQVSLTQDISDPTHWVEN